VQHLLPVEPPDRPWEVIRVALLNLGVAAALCLLMLGGVLHEKRRFAGEDRRLGFALPGAAEVAAALRAPPADMAAWRAARRLVVHHDPAGNVVRADTGG
jgi:poly-beta-1,6-N-acetyl-D-glucosamine biosynthesis protein PgaD